MTADLSEESSQCQRLVVAGNATAQGSALAVLEAAKTFTLIPASASARTAMELEGARVARKDAHKALPAFWDRLGGTLCVPQETNDEERLKDRSLPGVIVSQVESICAFDGW